MTEEQKLLKIALKEAIKFVKIKTKSTGANFGTRDVLDFATTFYQFLKQK